MLRRKRTRILKTHRPSVILHVEASPLAIVTFRRGVGYRTLKIFLVSSTSYPQTSRNS